MKILIYDIAITGHHSEYIGHLVTHINKNPDGNEYFFVIHPNFSSKFPVISKIAKRTNDIKWIEVAENELEKTLPGGLIKKSFSSFKLLNKYALKYKIDQVILLHLNIFQFALIFKRTNYEINGILFRPFYRMNTSSAKGKLLFVKKFLQTKLTLLNKKINHIYVLNDNKTVKYFNNAYHTTIFKVLYDPVKNVIPKDKFLISDYHCLENKRKVFLHFGSLTDRKGTLEILDSLFYLDDKILKIITLLLIGKADNSIEYQINKKINALKTTKPFSSIIFRNEFIPENEMKSYFEQSDYFLMPYKNVESSSGILGHAIAAGKPVLSTNNGLIEDIVTKHKAGILIDEVNPTNIKSGIIKLLTSDILLINREIYIKKHSPSNFSKTLIKKFKLEYQC